MKLFYFIYRTYSIHTDGVAKRRQLFQHSNFQKESNESYLSIDKMSQCEDENSNINNSYNCIKDISQQVFQQQNDSKTERYFVSENQEDRCEDLTNEKQIQSDYQTSTRYEEPVLLLSRNKAISQIRNDRFNQRKSSYADKNGFVNFNQLKKQRSGNLLLYERSENENKTINNTNLFKESTFQDQDQENEKKQKVTDIKLVTFYYIYKFIKVFLLKYIQQDITLLSVFQHQIINDKAVVVDKTQNQLIQGNSHKFNLNIFEKIKYLRENRLKVIQQTDKTCIDYGHIFINQCLLALKCILFQFQIISPNHLLLMIWDILFISHYLLFLIVYPFQLSFDENGSFLNMLISLQKISLFATIFDSFLGFHTGIYEFGEIVVKRKQVFQKYKNDRLLFDLLCIGFLIIGIQREIELICVLSFIFRYSSVIFYLFSNIQRNNNHQKQINEKVSRINMNLQLQSKLQAYYDLLKLLFYILILIHIFGCGFYLVGHLSSKQYEDLNWITDVKLNDSTNQEKYISSIYFITITMVTIGYGDIHPINQYEKLYMIVVAFISCGLFAFSVNLIGFIATEIQKKSSDLHQKQNIIQMYLNSRQIENVSQMRVLKYLEFLNDSQEETTLQGQKILHMCSKEIKEDILKEYFGKILSKCPLLQEKFSIEFMKQLSLKMQEKSFAPGQVIVERGKKMFELYFITQGETEYYFNRQDSLPSICDYENKVIDLKTFMSQQESEVSIRSKGITIVTYIDYNSFLDTLSPFQTDKEKFCKLRDQFLNDSRYQYPCKSCGLFKHMIFECPQLVYKVNQTKFLQKHQERITQNRDNNFYRLDKNNIRQKCNSLVINMDIRQELKLIRCDLANQFYNQQYSQPNFDQTPFLNYDDKQFFQAVPKINLIWFEKQNKECFNLDNQLVKNFRHKQIFKKKNHLETSFSNSSDSSASSIETKTKIRSNQLLSKNNNFRRPSIRNDTIIAAAAFALNEQNQQHGNQNVKGEVNLSEFLIPSEQKIPMNIRRQSTLYLQNFQLEDQLSLLSQNLIPDSLCNTSNQINDNTNVEQINNLITAHKQKSPDKREKPKQRQQNQQSVINIGSEFKIPSKTSFNKQMKESYQVVKNNSLIDTIEYSTSQNQSPMNNSIQPQGMMGNFSAANSMVGLNRGSFVQGQLLEQIQAISNILKQQCSFNEKQYSFHTRSNKSKKTQNEKQSQGKKNSLSHSHTNTTLSKNKSNTGKFTRYSIAYSDNINLFGKCGLQFEIFKEFKYYYPKFNYSFVVRAYKKQLQLNYKRKQGSILGSQKNQCYALKNNKKKLLQTKISLKIN